VVADAAQALALRAGVAGRFMHPTSIVVPVKEEKNMIEGTHRGDKPKAHRRIVILFSLILSGFFILTVMNELLDVPHYLFGDARTSLEQRRGEVISEAVIYVVVVSIAFYFYDRLQRRINILEGILPICANCKKIRQDLDWVALEEYISSHSLAEFSHALCPECIRKLYPEYADEIISKMKSKETK
jgi:hypothetical protein